MHKFESIQDKFDIVEENIRTFPSTRYYGSKRRSIYWIYGVASRINFHSALDAFGGTCSVSLLFKAMGKQVTFNDALTFNTIGAKALLMCNTRRPSLSDVRRFLVRIRPATGFITQTFDNAYYTRDENRWLDGCAAALERLRSDELYRVIFYCLIQACLKKRPFNLFHRANLYLRINGRKMQTRFGNGTTWETPFPDLIISAFHEWERLTWKSSVTNVVLPPTDVFSLKGKYDLVYLDPPYMPQNRVSETYLKRYHFLEGLARYQDWPLFSSPNGDLARMSGYEHVLSWHNRQNYMSLLCELLDRFRSSIVILSYTANGYPSTAKLLAEMKHRFARVRVYEWEVSGALSKNKRTELLFVGYPK